MPRQITYRIVKIDSIAHYHGSKSNYPFKEYWNSTYGWVASPMAEEFTCDITDPVQIPYGGMVEYLTPWEALTKEESIEYQRKLNELNRRIDA